MIEQLKELLEMQRVLDASILAKQGIRLYPKELVQVALYVELGELMNELPSCFKYWKESKVDNREKALIEYVDCLHFALSLANNRGKAFEKDLSLNKDLYEYNEHKVASLSQMLINKLLVSITLYEGDLSFLFGLGYKLGFTWDEIYKAYKKKNAINYERMKENY